tara:strand:- start:204 stop:740 length:537 start_codon:yes stop_codon:yes gene_type:complete
MASSHLYGQSVQRLFSTPALRAELDRLRFQVLSGVVIEESVDEEPIIQLPVFGDDEVDIVYALGGTMRRADDSYTVWINNIAYDQASLPANMELLLPYSQGQLLIRDTESAASFKVKPGQVLNLSTGQLYESYQYEAVLAADAARIAEQEADDSRAGTNSLILDSAPAQAVLEAAQDL